MNTTRFEYLEDERRFKDLKGVIKGDILKVTEDDLVTESNPTYVYKDFTGIKAFEEVLNDVAKNMYEGEDEEWEEVNENIEQVAMYLLYTKQIIPKDRMTYFEEIFDLNDLLNTCLIYSTSYFSETDSWEVKETNYYNDTYKGELTYKNIVIEYEILQNKHNYEYTVETVKIRIKGNE